MYLHYTKVQNSIHVYVVSCRGHATLQVIVTVIHCSITPNLTKCKMCISLLNLFATILYIANENSALTD